MAAPAEPFEKDIYMEHPDVTRLSRSEAEQWRHHHRITVSDNRAPKPVRTFLEAAFPEPLTVALEQSGFPSPTPIQSQSWPIALSGRDMIGLASTGSGKTLCFALPAIVHILAQDHLKPGDGPIGVFLAPTRELALQIKEECDKFGASSGVRNTAVYGGVPKGPQQRDLGQGVEICIATPGRLLDFMDEGVTNLQRCTFLVLDEADRMMDFGFEPQLRRVVECTRPDRQTLMWSATWPREVQKLAREFLTDAVQVQVNNAGDLRATESVDQRFEMCDDASKLNTFFQILQAVGGAGKTIIFCEKKRGCEALKEQLGRRGVSASALHGDKSQQERDYTMQQFKSGAVRVLVATDVAGRGLDVKDVQVVINYDAPSSAEDYVHRIGRAGRAGATGTAFTLLTPSDGYVAREIARMMRKSRSGVPHALERAANMGGRDDGYRRWRS
eukprot:Transcript_12132.p1 GENE.Transcript_12132~~Transcript_12132.p1  ORF type:complete len:467 (-),score=209.52 Transcript_12132:58-1386(-)